MKDRRQRSFDSWPRIQGLWQQELPAREYLEQVNCCHDTDCNESLMKKGVTSLKNGTWEEYKETFRTKMKASEWAFDRGVRLGSKEEVEKMSIVQEIMLKSTDYLRRIIAPVGEQGGVTMSYLWPNCNSFPLADYVWWVSAGRTTKWWCAICREKYDWRQPNRLLVVQTGEIFEQAKVFKAVPQGLCENLINALKLLANQQEDGDGLLQNIVTNLGEGSRKGLTDGLGDFIWVDSNRALDVGELHRGTGT